MGDVTALCVLSPQHDDGSWAAGHRGGRHAHDTLLAGIGGCAHWYDPADGGLILCARVLSEARVHGLAPAPAFDAAAEVRGGRAVLAWGERRVAMVALHAPRGTGEASGGKSRAAAAELEVGAVQADPALKATGFKF